MNWNQLFYFNEVAKRQSIKSAAESLEISTAALSEQIRKIEKRLGKKLFRRSSNRIFLTEEGERTFSWTKEIFNLGQRFVDQMAPEQSVAVGYDVRVGLQENLFDLASVEFVTKYADLYAPFGTVNTERAHYLAELREWLIKGVFDWTITLSAINAKALVSQKLASYQIEFACLKSVYDRFVSRQDLFRTIPLALGTKDRGLSHMIKMNLAKDGIAFDEIIETDHREYSWRLLERGRAIVPVVREVAKEIHQDENICYFGSESMPSLDLFVSWRRESENMVCIRKLKELLSTNEYPLTFSDPDFLIDISDVPEDKLK